MVVTVCPTSPPTCSKCGADLAWQTYYIFNGAKWCPDCAAPMLAGLQELAGGTCSECGFFYRAYHGHLEPCPRCAIQRVLKTLTPCIIEQWRIRIEDLAALLDLFRDLRTSYPERRGEAA